MMPPRCPCGAAPLGTMGPFCSRQCRERLRAERGNAIRWGKPVPEWPQPRPPRARCWSHNPPQPVRLECRCGICSECLGRQRFRPSAGAA